MIKAIKEKAKQLLEVKQVDLIIGYQRTANGVSARPVFIDKEKDVDKLIWDAYCVYNLSNYLKDFAGKKIGIIAKGCDVKSIIVLLQEKQLKRENVFIIAVECFGVIDEKRLALGKKEVEEIVFDNRCGKCKLSTPPLYDVLISQQEKKDQTPKLEEDPYEAVRKFEAKSIQERFNLWQEEFSRCIRCYACREICPSCYCPKCVIDQTMPGWFSKASDLKGKFSWNILRAMHLAGRCVDCGECERACPVGIPLNDINKKIQKDVKELFNYETGTDIDQKPLLSGFDKNDPDDFIR